MRRHNCRSKTWGYGSRWHWLHIRTDFTQALDRCLLRFASDVYQWDADLTATVSLKPSPFSNMAAANSILLFVKNYPSGALRRRRQAALLLVLMATSLALTKTRAVSKQSERQLRECRSQACTHQWDYVLSSLSFTRYMSCSLRPDPKQPGSSEKNTNGRWEFGTAPSDTLRLC